jgi:hypothetical protein
MTKKVSPLEHLSKSGKLSAADRSVIQQMIELIRSTRPSQITDTQIVEMEMDLHRLYYSPQDPIVKEVKNWIGVALDAMSSAAYMVPEHSDKRPREVSKNLRSTLDALENVLVEDDQID